jgi:hypothetical protein
MQGGFLSQERFLRFERPHESNEPIYSIPDTQWRPLDLVLRGARVGYSASLRRGGQSSGKAIECCAPDWIRLSIHRQGSDLIRCLHSSRFLRPLSPFLVRPDKLCPRLGCMWLQLDLVVRSNSYSLLYQFDRSDHSGLSPPLTTRCDLKTRTRIDRLTQRLAPGRCKEGV